jgi:predicted dehydrogenase
MLLTEEDTYVHLDCTLPRAVHDRRLTFLGTDGKLSIDGGRDTCQYWHLEEAEDAPYGQTHVKQKLPQTLDGFSDQRAMFRNGAAHVVELLEGTAENISPGSDAAHVLETIVALFLSHYTNSAVELPLSRPLRDVRIQSQ